MIHVFFWLLHIKASVFLTKVTSCLFHVTKIVIAIGSRKFFYFQGCLFNWSLITSIRRIKHAQCKLIIRRYNILVIGASMQSVAPFIDIRCTIFMNKTISSVITDKCINVRLNQINKIGTSSYKNNVMCIGNQEKTNQ